MHAKIDETSVAEARLIYLFIYFLACHKVRFVWHCPCIDSFFICTLNVADVQTDCHPKREFMYILYIHMCICVIQLY